MRPRSRDSFELLPETQRLEDRLAEFAHGVGDGEIAHPDIDSLDS